MLKAFRSWWEQSKYFFNNAFQARWVRIGWKAALRWVLKDLCSRCSNIDEIREAINEELKNV